MDERSQGSGVVFEFEKAAMKGDEMPSGLSGPDQWMFLSLRNLYAAKAVGKIDRDAGGREKRKLIDTYRLMQDDRKIAEYRTATIKATELARSAYRKDRSLENADKLIEVFDGCKLKEVT